MAILTQAEQDKIKAGATTSRPAGALAEFRRRLLGAAEAQTIYASRGQDFILSGITGHWQLAEGGQGVAVATAVDVSGKGGSAGPIGAPVYTGGLTLTRRRARTTVGPRSA